MNNNSGTANKKQSGFTSRLGFILAAAGSAVGLGNIWRFPYLAAKYGGGIFLLVYLLLAITFGFAIMITEIAIGRKTGKSSILAFKQLNRKWAFLGWVEALVPCIIFPYYCVIGGWVVKFMITFLTGGGGAAANDTYFTTFIGGTVQPIVYLAIFMIITAVIILCGVQKGIEKTSKILMPILVVMTVGISIYVLTLPGAIDGLIYYIKPNFKLFSIKTVIAASGQVFYSMSLAMAIMITYGSYMSKKDDLEKSVRHIEIFDTGIAFFAGLMVVPAVLAFSNGDMSKLQAGPTLMFITLPKVFDAMPAGHIVGAIFFALVFFAALTSSVSIMEAIVSILTDRFKISRIKASIIIICIALIIGIPSALGFGILENIKIFGMVFLDFFDFISNNILMPIVGLLTCIFVGFVLKPKAIEDEVLISSERFKAKKLHSVVIKYIAPIFLLVILFSSIFLQL